MPRRTHFKPVLSFHNRTSVAFHTQIEKQQQMLTIVRSALPYNLAKSVHSCILRDHKLIIYTDSSAWASQLRFYSPALLSHIHSKTVDQLKLVQCRIYKSIETRSPDERHRVAKLPSLENITLIHKNIINTPESRLKASLLKLNKKFKLLHAAGGMD